MQEVKVSSRSKRIFALPGVPAEFEAMFSEHVLSYLKQIAGMQFEVRSLRIFGKSEAAVNSLLREAKLSPEIRVAFCVSFPEVQVVLAHPDPKLLDSSQTKVIEMLGPEFIFSQTDLSLEESVHALLLQKGLTLGLAESCTGGQISALLTRCPGSSGYFFGTIVSYANQVKISELDVPAEVIERYGAVSSETARAMALGALKRLRSDLALSVTGIAGPDGGTAEKPVGTFFVGFARRDELSVHHYLYPASREYVRRYASYVVLDLIRRQLSGYALDALEYKPH
jgi:nicotinamide-nucleotide amidase